MHIDDLDDDDLLDALMKGEVTEDDLDLDRWLWFGTPEKPIL